jgi:hypothetical protein
MEGDRVAVDQMDEEVAAERYPVVYRRRLGEMMAIVGSSPRDDALLASAGRYGLTGWPGQVVRVRPYLTAPLEDFRAFCTDLLRCIEEGARGDGAASDDMVYPFSPVDERSPAVTSRRGATRMGRRSDPLREDGVVVQFYVEKEKRWYELGCGDMTARCVGSAEETREYNLIKKPVEYHTSIRYVQLRAKRWDQAFADLVKRYGVRNWPGQELYEEFPRFDHAKVYMEVYFTMLLDRMQHHTAEEEGATTSRGHRGDEGPWRDVELGTPRRRVWGGDDGGEEAFSWSDGGWAGGGEEDDSLVSTRRPPGDVRSIPVPSYTGSGGGGRRPAGSTMMSKEQLLEALRVLERMVERMDGEARV